MTRTPFQDSTTVGRTIVASYDSYQEAQKAVDYLADNNFKVEKLAIVAEGLKFVEQVTGKLNWGRVISQSAASGALSGVIIGLIMGLLFNIPLLNIVLYGLFLGILVSLVLGVTFYAMSGGQRDFSSVGGMQADRYNIMADADIAQEAQRLLAGMH